MNRTVEIAPVRKSLIVETSQQRAFEVFTAGIDRWWPRTHAIGKSPPKKVVIEPKPDGRVYEIDEDGSEVDWGRILKWDPPHGFAFSWQISADWQPQPGEPVLSEVEVAFVDVGGGKTRLDLLHRNFERMGAEAGSRMREQVNGGWPGLLELFAQAVAK